MHPKGPSTLRTFDVWSDGEPMARSFTTQPTSQDPPASFSIPDDNLLTPVLRWSSTRPDHPIVATRIGSDFVDKTAQQLWDDVRDTAKYLIGLGVAVGDRVAVMAPTSLAWLELDLAVAAIGAITVPIYETSSSEQIGWILEDSGAKLLFVGSDSLAARVPTEPALVTTVALGKRQADGPSNDEPYISDAEFEARLNAIRSIDVATIIYTSGTTGRPKGCVLTHHNLRANVHQIADALGETINDQDVALVSLSLAHVLTKMTVLYCLEKGAKVAFGSGVGRMASELSLVRPTVITAVPRIFEKAYSKAQYQSIRAGRSWAFERSARIAIRFSRDRAAGAVSRGLRLEHALFQRLVYGKIASRFGGRLRMAFCGGAPLGEHLASFFDGAGIRIYEGYGLTETSPILTISRSDAWRPGSVGRIVGGTSIRCADDGELLVKGPQVFSRYWRQEDATREAFDRDGWFRTGDIGEIDDDGFLSITGRSKDLIVTAAGKNVAPAPLEDLLRPHPVISQAVIIGDGRPFVAALITLDHDGLREWALSNQLDELTTANLRASQELHAEVQTAVDHANRSVSRAEEIKKFAILPDDFSLASDEITPTLKVKRAVVHRKYRDVIEAMYHQSEDRVPTTGDSRRGIQ